MAFDPKNLVAATSVEALAQAGARRGTKAVTLDNIARQIELIDPKRDGKRTFWDTVVDGKRSYTGQGSHVGFTIRVANRALRLQGDVQELAVPKSDFRAALEHFAREVAADKFKAQLDALDGAREQRTNKMRETRKAKKTDKPTK